MNQRRGGQFSWRAVSLTLLLAASLGSAPGPAFADGAIAVGHTGNISQDGFSFGVTVNAVNETIAREHALENCRTDKHSPANAHDACVVVMSFRGKCASFAMDPGAGTPGVGWAVAASRRQAVAQAMANCIATAGASRREYCEESDTRCDGRAR